MPSCSVHKRGFINVCSECVTAAMDARRYHVVVINERSGTKTYFTEQPVTHDQGCAWLKKITDYPWRRKQLEEVSQ